MAVQFCLVSAVNCGKCVSRSLWKVQVVKQRLLQGPPTKDSFLITSLSLARNRSTNGLALMLVDGLGYFQVVSQFLYTLSE